MVAGACFYSPEVKPLVRDCRLTTQTLLQLVKRRNVTRVFGYQRSYPRNHIHVQRKRKEQKHTNLQSGENATTVTSNS